MSAVLIPVEGKWQEIKRFKIDNCLSLLKEALEEKVRDRFRDSELGMGCEGKYLWSALLHGGDPRLVRFLGGENRQAWNLLGLEFHGPVLVFRETKSGKMGRTTIKLLQKKPKKKRKRATIEDLIEATGIPLENVIRIEMPQIIPDSKCEHCDEPAVYPIVKVEGRDLKLTFCKEHHVIDEKKKKARVDPPSGAAL